MKAHAERQEQDLSRRFDWHTTIEGELTAVEILLMECCCSEVPTVFELSKHLVTAGGKRLRPALVILSAQAAGGCSDPARVTPIAATVELIHMASLVHDDVIDNSESRRGRITANAFWGNKVSVLSGDYMLAKAFTLLSRETNQRIMAELAEMTSRMSEIEVLQAISEGDIDMWREHYWDIIRHKTAGFLSSCCRCGAILAGASEEVEESLASYGMELGFAFQLTDDLLDIIGDPTVTGKPVGNDLRDGKFTLPLLLAMDGMEESGQVRLRAAVKQENLSSEEIQRVIELIDGTGAIEMTRDRARSCVERASLALDSLSSSPATENLKMIAEQIIDRIN
jgi:geranylgeranyl pyrophosphate synthase